MKLSELLLAELEREAVGTRHALERVPEGHNSWKPHPKSMELGYLAALVATMPSWVALMINHDELDLDGNGKSFRTRPVQSREELLALLDQGTADARRALENTTEEHLRKPWKLTMGPQVLSYRPRYSSIIDGALSHLAHRRGQLTVYLRLNDASVPAIYGPSADEWN